MRHNQHSQMPCEATAFIPRHSWITTCQLCQICCVHYPLFIISLSLWAWLSETRFGIGSHGIISTHCGIDDTINKVMTFFFYLKVLRIQCLTTRIPFYAKSLWGVFIVFGLQNNKKRQERLCSLDHTKPRVSAVQREALSMQREFHNWISNFYQINRTAWRQTTTVLKGDSCFPFLIRNCSIICWLIRGYQMEMNMCSIVCEH